MTLLSEQLGSQDLPKSADIIFFIGQKYDLEFKLRSNFILRTIILRVIIFPLNRR